MFSYHDIMICYYKKYENKGKSNKKIDNLKKVN